MYILFIIFTHILIKIIFKQDEINKLKTDLKQEIKEVLSTGFDGMLS
jgi:hypothetical protein